MPTDRPLGLYVALTASVLFCLWSAVTVATELVDQSVQAGPPTVTVTGLQSKERAEPHAGPRSLGSFDNPLDLRPSESTAAPTPHHRAAARTAHP